MNDNKAMRKYERIIERMTRDELDKLRMATIGCSMKSNRFGSAEVVDGGSLRGPIYITSAACMTLYAETLGWANATENRRNVVVHPEAADNIVVLTCQVTDLAILNDFRVMEGLMKKYPGKRYLIGGCLAQRFDIDLPDGVERLEHLRSDYGEIDNFNVVHYEPPFWVKDFKEEDREFSLGHLFRHMYPLRVSVGCHGNCEYCTIRTTRCGAYDLDVDRLSGEFYYNDDILIVADSLTREQIIKCGRWAMQYDTTISLRNVEPHQLVSAKAEVEEIAKKGLLKVLHSPIQALCKDVLTDMRRDYDSTMEAVEFMRMIQEKYGVFIATNIIIDYKDFPNDFDVVYALFDYVSWNPYWDSNWDRGTAEKRWQNYFGNN